MPVPGGPKSRTPFGMRAPRLWNFLGFSRNSLISWSSSTASSAPATSLNVILGASTAMRLARRLAEAHHLGAAALHAVHQVDPEPDEEDERGEPDEGRPPRRARDALHLERDVRRLELADEGVRVVRRVAGGVLRVVLERDVNGLVLDLHDRVLGTSPSLDLLGELVERGRGLGRLARDHEALGDEHQQDHDQDRERRALQELVQPGPPSGPRLVGAPGAPPAVRIDDLGGNGPPSRHDLLAE